MVKNGRRDKRSSAFADTPTLPLSGTPSDRYMSQPLLGCVLGIGGGRR